MTAAYPLPNDFSGALSKAALVSALNTTPSLAPLQAPGAPASTTANTIVADAHLLRSFGAAFDGVTDDAPAFNAVVAAASKLLPAVDSGVPTIIFNLPAAVILMGSPLVTSGQHVAMRGMGAQNTVLLASTSNTLGLWQHGTAASPSKGYVEIENMMFRDAGRGASGSTALTFYFQSGVIPTIRINTVRVHLFGRGIYMLNPPRDINVYALTVYGPDFKVQPNAGVVVESTQGGPNVFTTSWIVCNVFNYLFGWDFIGGGMIEGHRFYGSTAYNGWGMVRAYVHGDGIPGLTGYQAVIWDFYCCDWQGWGYAFDMRNVRGVRIRGGFYTMNSRTAASGTTIAAPWGARTSAATNAMMSFSNAADVLIADVQIDVDGSGTWGDTVLGYFDDGCTHCRVKDNAIYVNSSMYGGFELGAIGASSAPNNTLKILSNEWLNWISGDKVIDHASKQIDLPWIRDNYYGEQFDSGLFLLQQQVQVTMQSAQLSDTDTTEIAQAYIKFPSRRYGVNCFNGGAPTVVMSSQQALAEIGFPIELGETDRAGFYVRGDKSLIEMVVTINYLVTGW
ncbi:hypothetical protein AD929_11700 [Gluconobacter potus]|uniref:Pectate lyase superfamily protein domain-containing protein n=1 Tax=Gluconobacter potus TaxID=2724927 RepID=A0A149QSJ5_9PROT|nr:hypothetical protein [Gluconobacter potus]KXV00288.1 hypothetical protein AD929_11700 [Gluconobacter potus]